MKLLIIGSSGQLGKSIISGLNHYKYDAIFLDSKQLDISNKKNVSIKIKEISPDLIVNAAAYTNVDKAEVSIELAFKVNAAGPENIVEACKSKNIPIIHISTDYVFDGLKSSPYKPSDTTNPISVYGKSKLAGEHFIENYDHGFIIRTSWLFSEFNNNFYSTILHLANHYNEVKVVNDEIGCPTYAGDLSEAILKSASKIISGKLSPGTYHFSGDNPCSWYQFAEIIIREGYAQKKIKTLPKLIPVTSKEFHKNFSIRPKFSALDSTKLCIQLNVKTPQWEEAVSRLLLG
jgi:dTDP-4-dehydrorhamnose reductase